MKLEIIGRHVEVTDALRQYVNSKLARIDRHSDRVIDAHVTLFVEKNQQIAEARLQLAGKDFHVRSIHANLYAAIDGLVDRMDRQVLRHKEKQQTSLA